MKQTKPKNKERTKKKKKKGATANKKQMSQNMQVYILSYSRLFLIAHSNGWGAGERGS